MDFGGTRGGSEAFDFAVLSAPPTSWPAISASTPFEPRRFSMAQGPAIKFLTGFDREFWKDDALAPSALWTALGSVWEGTDAQSGSGGFGLSVYAGGPYASPAPNCAARLAVLYRGPKPKQSQYLNWPAVPFIKTGYAVPAPGQVTTVGRALASPLEGRLFFAGEQASMGFFGYMEGALQSGARAARDLVSAVCPAARGLRVA